MSAVQGEADEMVVVMVVHKPFPVVIVCPPHVRSGCSNWSAPAAPSAEASWGGFCTASDLVMVPPRRFRNAAFGLGLGGFFCPREAFFSFLGSEGLERMREAPWDG